MISNNDDGSVTLNNLTNDSPSFGFLEYFLRLSLHSSTVRIINAWEVSNPQLILQFEKRAKDILILDSWLDVASLPNGNSEEEVVRRGFQLGASSSGIKLCVGRVNLKQNEDGVIRKRMLLCKAAVGRSYNTTEDFAKTANIPEGYDSFVVDCHLIEQQQPHTETETETLTDQLEYIVKDGKQILPTYVVVFEYDAEQERRSRQKSQCDNCESAPAIVFCQADSANLCQNCDQALHNSKLTARHTRTPLEAGPQTFSTCRTHTDKIVEFFCPTCSLPVCVHCKMVGHHSTGDTARHKLITVSEAFKGVSEAAKATDPLLEARKRRIMTQIAAVQERTGAVEANATEVQQQLEELYKRAQMDLKAITKRKMNILKGDLIELHREAAEIHHLESFLEYQANGGNTTQFILDWASHQRLRGELHAFPHFRETIDVHPDVKINGSIQVHVDALAAPSSVALGYAGEDNPMKASTLFDRPRYGVIGGSPSRSRTGTPTVDFSSLTKTVRKQPNEIESILANSGALGKI